MSVLDERMLEIAADRRGTTLAERELAELAAGTDAIEQGARSPLLWTLVIGGLVAAPFTLGVSLLVSLVAGIAMSGGPRHMVRAALPMTVDIVAPKAGCIRVITGLTTIVLVILAALLIVCVIAFALGVTR